MTACVLAYQISLTCSWIRFKNTNTSRTLYRGPRDQGVDVLLKGAGDDEPDKYIALQVKSYREIDDKDNDLAKVLKAGYLDADSAYKPRLQRYYILLFGDAIKHQKRLDAITGEFTKQSAIRVISPRSLITFLELPASTIAAVVDRYLSDEDYVRKAARYEINEHSESELYFLLACLTWALENSTSRLPEKFFVAPRIQAFVENYGHDALDAARDAFEDIDFEVYAAPASTRVRIENYPAIRALYYDLQVRYGEEPDELFNHIFEFLRDATEHEE
jgi:hypothetical protein